MGTKIGHYPITREDGTTVQCGYIISDGDVTWPNDYTNQAGCSLSDPCFILAKGKVTVLGSDANSFNGLIISGNDVELAAASTTVNSDSEAIEKLFEYDKKQAKPVFYNLMQEYFRKSVEAAIGNDGSSSNTNNVSYENWKKNG